MRDHEPPPLPQPASGDRDVTAQGAQLLRRRTQLAAGRGLVSEPLRCRDAPAWRELAPLHEPARVRRRRRADALGAGRAPGHLHGPRSHRPHAVSLSPQRRRRVRRPRADRRLGRPAVELREQEPLPLPARAVPGELRARADRDRHPRGVEAGPTQDHAAGLPVPRRRSGLHLRAVRARVGDGGREGRRPLPVHGSRRSPRTSSRST